MASDQDEAPVIQQKDKNKNSHKTRHDKNKNKARQEQSQDKTRQRQDNHKTKTRQGKAGETLRWTRTTKCVVLKMKRKIVTKRGTTLTTYTSLFSFTKLQS
jgi:hypothetical protein